MRFLELMYLLAFSFDGDRAITAMLCTGDATPTELPTGLTNEFAADPGKATQWMAFGRKSGAYDAPDRR